MGKQINWGKLHYMTDPQNDQFSRLRQEILSSIDILDRRGLLEEGGSEPAPEGSPIHDIPNIEVESNPDILGGALCFKGTRITVDHIGRVAMKVPHYQLRELAEDYKLTCAHILYALGYTARKEPPKPVRYREDSADQRLAAKAKELVDALVFDDSGSAGKGGNGGLISRETIRHADELRAILAGHGANLGKEG